MASFIRYVQLSVGRLVTDSHFITFSIRRRSEDTQADGTIQVYNLSPTNEKRISERGLPVVLNAGYLRPSRSVAEIFRGDVVRFERQRIGNDRVSVIHVGNEVMKQTAATLERTYVGPVRTRVVVRDLANALGLPYSGLENVPNAVINDTRISGLVTDNLRTVLRNVDARFYIDGGVVYFTRVGARIRPSESAGARIVVSQSSGMIGTPTVTDDGIRVRTILEHRINLGSTIRVISIGESLGVFKVVEIEHAGDNRQGEFTTLVEGRPL